MPGNPLKASAEDPAVVPVEAAAGLPVEVAAGAGADADAFNRAAPAPTATAFTKSRRVMGWSSPSSRSIASAPVDRPMRVTCTSKTIQRRDTRGQRARGSRLEQRVTVENVVVADQGMGARRVRDEGGQVQSLAQYAQPEVQQAIGL